MRLLNFIAAFEHLLQYLHEKYSHTNQSVHQGIKQVLHPRPCRVVCVVSLAIGNSIHAIDDIREGLWLWGEAAISNTANYGKQGLKWGVEGEWKRGENKTRLQNIL